MHQGIYPLIPISPSPESIAQMETAVRSLDAVVDAFAERHEGARPVQILIVADNDDIGVTRRLIETMNARHGHSIVLVGGKDAKMVDIFESPMFDSPIFESPIFESPIFEIHPRRGIAESFGFADAFMREPKSRLNGQPWFRQFAKSGRRRMF